MKREIKFRAWDKKIKIFYKIFGFAFYENQIRIWYFSNYLQDLMLNQSFHVDNIVLEQFIGRKDEDGKEIYEGDIIKGCHYTFNDKEISLVEWEEGGSGVHTWNGYTFDADYVKVIGNIHENPELLEES